MNNLYQQRLLVLLSCLLISIGLQAQNGKLRGKIFDSDTGETIPFATVYVIETGIGTTSDLDGSYFLDMSPGKYSVEVAFIGFESVIVEDLKIEENSVEVIDIRLQEESQLIEEIIVSANKINNTELAILSLQKNSSNLLDGISSQSIKKMGDSNAAAAIKRVTGVSVEEGKYVYVRGLGDRYNRSLLNAMDLPGLDPDRNSIQMDLIPTNLIDNMVVLKSYSADLPGDFSGGLVNIVTKDFPDRKTINFSTGISYNPEMHFQKGFLGYQGSSTDWLGLDDGMRSLPFGKSTIIPSIADNNMVLNEITGKFHPVLASERIENSMDYSFSLSAGNQFNRPNLTFGYNMALNYKNMSEFYKDVQYNSFIKNRDPSLYILETDRSQSGQLGKKIAMLSGMLGTSLKMNNHKFTFQIMHIQNGESTAGQFDQNSYIFTSNTILRDNLEYTQRSITNGLLTGKHSFKEGNFLVEWKVSPTLSLIYDKDVRVTPLRLDDGKYSIEPSEGAIPLRLYRNLEEKNYSGILDITRKFFIGDSQSKLKMGFRSTMKDRSYEILSYRFNVKGQSQIDFTGDPNQILQSQNLWTPEQGFGTYVEGNFEPANTYKAQQNIWAFYALHEHFLTEKIKLNYGLRAEKFEHIYTGQNNNGSLIYDSEKLIDKWNFLPSFNAIYSLSKNMNVRASYSHTLARPSFKEFSIAQIYDAISDRTYIGNIELIETRINNFDLRWEVFLPMGQMISISTFYKRFKNPIEVVPFSRATPSNFQPKNVGDARVGGVEFEFRKNLAFISKILEPVSVGSNTTMVYSKVEMDKSPNGEYESRVQTARQGEIVQDTRQMQGQAPYIINTYFNYQDIERSWEFNLSYNVQGKRLAITGIGEIPDIYDKPFHSLNVKLSKKLGKENQYLCSMSVTNLLNSDHEKVYQAFHAPDELFEKYKEGRTITMQFSYLVR